MTGQLSFNLERATEAKRAGMDQAAEARAALLERARTLAVEIAMSRGQVTADDVYSAMEYLGLNPKMLGNAAGSVFNGKRFRFTGRWQKSTRVTNHAHQNRVWELAC